jgi:hypothetical protein
MRRLGWPIAVMIAFAGLLAGPGHLWAAPSPAAFCRQAGTDDTLHEIPDSMVPVVVQLFGLSAMPAAQVRLSTYFRCFDHHVLVCNAGANLPCGKADARRQLAGAEAWCAENPASDFIPMYVTGHATIYRWRCDGPKAVTGSAVFKVDPRGFVAEFWKQADP